MKTARGTIGVVVTAVVVVGIVAVMLLARRPLPNAQGSPTGSAVCQQRLSLALADANTALFSVASLSQQDAWAVGTQYLHAAILHWDGGSWKGAAAPAPAATSSTLLAVRASNARDVWAVGRVDLRPLVLHWNGTAWAQVEAAPIAAYSSQFSALAVVASGDVWALGSAVQTPRGTPHTIAEHWDGHSWQIAPAPPGKTIVALAANAAGAVWGIVTATDNTQQLVRWDGQAWRSLPSPDPDAERLDLRTIAVGADGTVWVAGSFWPASADWAEPIVERWNGGAWSRVPISAPEARGAWVVSLAVNSDATVWAGGMLRNPNTRLDNAFLARLGAQGASTMKYYPAFYTDPHRGDSFTVTAVAAVPGGDAAWLIGGIGSVPDASFPPIDTNLPVASGAFVLQSC